MSRLRTIGFEVGGFNTTNANATDIEGYNDGIAAVTVETTVKVSGAQSARVTASDISTCRVHLQSNEVAAGRRYFLRTKFRVTALPTSTIRVLQIRSEGNGDRTSLRLTSGGKMQLFNDVAGTQVGSDSSGTVAVDTWYTLELSALFASGSADDEIEGRLDGTSIASATGLTLDTAAPQYFIAGFINNPGQGASNFGYLDDLIINDDQGASNNSWPGVNEKVIYLKPTADSQVGDWTGGAGGTTNLFDALDNVPPVGTATETDSTQIENAINGGGTNYIATLQSYTTGGVPSGATINAVTVLIVHGEDIATGAKTGQVKVASNPSGSFGTFTFGFDVGALGTFPGNWRGRHVSENAPSVTLGTSPTIELDKTDATTRVASVCSLGLYVGYTEGGGEPPAGQPTSKRSGGIPGMAFNQGVW